MIECSLFTDDFTNAKSIVVSNVAGINRPWISFVGSAGLPIVQVTFVASAEAMFIKLFSLSSDYQMNKGDEIVFLLENGTPLRFAFAANGTRGCNICPVSLNEISALASLSTVKIRITTGLSRDVFLFYNSTPPSAIIKSAVEYESELHGMLLFKEMANAFTQTVTENFPSLINQNNNAGTFYR